MASKKEDVAVAVEWMTKELIMSVKASTQLKRVSNRTRLNKLPLPYLINIIALTQCELLWDEASLEDLARAFLVVSYHLMHKDAETRIH